MAKKGTVGFNLGLNTSGFVGPAKKAEKATDSLWDSLNKLKNTIRGTRLSHVLDGFTLYKLRQINERLNRLGDGLDRFGENTTRFQAFGKTTSQLAAKMGRSGAMLGGVYGAIEASADASGRSIDAAFESFDVFRRRFLDPKQAATLYRQYALFAEALGGQVEGLADYLSLIDRSPLLSDKSPKFARGLLNDITKLGQEVGNVDESVANLSGFADTALSSMQRLGIMGVEPFEKAVMGMAKTSALFFKTGIAKTMADAGGKAKEFYEKITEGREQLIKTFAGMSAMDESLLAPMGFSGGFVDTIKTLAKDGGSAADYLSAIQTQWNDLMKAGASPQAREAFRQSMINMLGIDATTLLGNVDVKQVFADIEKGMTGQTGIAGVERAAKNSAMATQALENAIERYQRSMGRLSSRDVGSYTNLATGMLSQLTKAINSIDPKSLDDTLSGKIVRGALAFNEMGMRGVVVTMFPEFFKNLTTSFSAAAKTGDWGGFIKGAIYDPIVAYLKGGAKGAGGMVGGFAAMDEIWKSVKDFILPNAAWIGGKSAEIAIWAGEFLGGIFKALGGEMSSKGSKDVNEIVSKFAEGFKDKAGVYPQLPALIFGSLMGAEVVSPAITPLAVAAGSFLGSVFIAGVGFIAKNTIGKFWSKAASALSGEGGIAGAASLVGISSIPAVMKPATKLLGRLWIAGLLFGAIEGASSAASGWWPKLSAALFPENFKDSDIETRAKNFAAGVFKLLTSALDGAASTLTFGIWDVIRDRFKSSFSGLIDDVSVIWRSAMVEFKFLRDIFKERGDYKRSSLRLFDMESPGGTYNVGGLEYFSGSVYGGDDKLKSVSREGVSKIMELVQSRAALADSVVGSKDYGSLTREAKLAQAEKFFTQGGYGQGVLQKSLGDEIGRILKGEGISLSSADLTEFVRLFVDGLQKLAAYRETRFEKVGDKFVFAAEMQTRAAKMSNRNVTLSTMGAPAQ